MFSDSNTGPGSDDGGQEKFIPEKSYELSGVGMLLSLPQAYKGDVEFRSSIIDEPESDHGSCALCGMVI